jgi:hypothetical protein
LPFLFPYPSLSIHFTEKENSLFSLEIKEDFYKRSEAVSDGKEHLNIIRRVKGTIWQ